MSIDFGAIGTAFVKHYYEQFDNNRAALSTLYTEQSKLTFEGEQFMGTMAIMQKLTTLQFKTVQHSVTTTDNQPGQNMDTIITFVTGNLAVDGNTATPLKFAQIFHLIPTPNGSWAINTDIFRLVYC